MTQLSLITSDLDRSVCVCGGGGVALYPRAKTCCAVANCNECVSEGWAYAGGAFAFDYIPHAVKGGSCWDAVGPREMTPGSTWWGTAGLSPPLMSPMCFQRLLSFALSGTIRLSCTVSVVRHRISRRGQPAFHSSARQGHSAARSSISIPLPGRCLCLVH